MDHYERPRMVGGIHVPPIHTKTKRFLDDCKYHCRNFKVFCQTALHRRPRMLERPHILLALAKMKALFDDCRNHVGNHDFSCRKSSDEKKEHPIEIDLIDCRCEHIIRASTSTRYAALSYVCGRLKPLPLDHCHELCCPRIRDKLAPVYEDAIDIALFLDIRYIWIDQYCVEQKDPEVKRRQLEQMGHIYSNARITIVAAVFSHGKASLVPNSKPRKWLNNWDSEESDDEDQHRSNKELSEVLRIIEISKWNTRGWTFQETYRSTRTLVVHPRGMYFECGTASYRAIERTVIRGPIDASDPWFTVCCMSSGPAVRRYLHQPFTHALSWFTFLVGVYSRRSLKYESDAMNAFIAVLKLYHDQPACPVKDGASDTILWMEFDDQSHYRLWLVQGAPFFILDPRYKNDPDVFVRLEASALCWQHAHGQPVGISGHNPKTKAIKRRSGFPSWSWIGWTGAVCWTLPDNDYQYTPQNGMFFCFQDLHFRDSQVNLDSSCDYQTIKSGYSIEEAKDLVCPRLVFETILFKADTFQLVKEDLLHKNGKKRARIELMNYELPWFDKPSTLYHSQGSELDAETLCEHLQSERCRIALLYAHVTCHPPRFELQALILRKCVAAEECWYERVGGFHHQMPMKSGSMETEEDEQFSARLKEMFKEPDYELIEIR